MSSGNEGQIGMSETTVTPVMPAVVHEGRYRLYRKPDGGMRLQYKRDDKDVEDYIELPAAFMALAESAQQGKMSPMDLVKAMTTMMRNGGA